MNANQELVHNIRNDLFILQGFIKKLCLQNESVDKINKIINSIALKCSALTHSDKTNSESNIVNNVIEETLYRFTNIDFVIEFHEELYFYCNKSNFQDVLTNFFLNSIRAGASSITLTIINKSLIISDNGSCTEIITQKLNEGNFFTTKENDGGVGCKSIRDFFDKHHCQIHYSLSDHKSMIATIKFP